MDENEAIGGLAALAHAHRLAIFRLLVREGPAGLPAGRIGEALAIAPSALSFHLAALDHAGLLRSWRDGRNVFYAVEVAAMRRLLGFLTEDCCRGRPELCGDPAGLDRDELEKSDARR
ncbi:MAG: helix-turn-helix transcriptional regulator [Inquilinus sp.]|nr:helix-turn-helix transcriptional regulator [Inquilinus sp.]